MSDRVSSIEIIQWDGCYERRWEGMITSDAFAHPAKFSWGLIERIVTHGLTSGWWRPGDLIGDPFGGVATGGIVCAYHGLHWRGLELEEKFVALGKGNIERHRAKLAMIGMPLPVLLQGDSRRFAELVAADAIVTSPPYANSITDRGDGIDWDKTCETHRGSRTPGRGAIADGYGSNAGQIGALRAGDLDGVITSPPFLDRSTEPHKLGTGAPTRDDGDAAGRNKGDYHHGTSEGQIGQLSHGTVDAVITSPPWDDQESSMNAGKFKDPTAFAQAMSARDGSGSRNGTSRDGRLAQFARATQSTYGESQGQIGNVTGETYWEAMRHVYAQCRLAIKPGGIMCVVVKDCVKDRQRVPLCDQTLRLLEHVGFTPVCRIHAMLVKECSAQFGFDGKPIVTRKSRKSFFRRLAESKGSPAIDYEEVLVVGAPAEGTP